MDKVEAYKILIQELESIAKEPADSLVEFVGSSLETENVTQSGKHYSISVRVSQKNEKTFLLEGNIHDNDSFKYERLEEKIEVQK